MLNLRTYISIVIVAPMFVGLAVMVWDFSGFLKNCSAQGYSSDRYLAYCESHNYGDYEHGAYFLETEPIAVANLKSAEVVFLGNSRMQFAFSTNATKRAFQGEKSPKFHLLGFGFTEQYSFPLAVLLKLSVRPKVLIVGVDERFFLQIQSPPAFFVTTQRGAKSNYETKIIKQIWHQRVCTLEFLSNSFLCGKFGSIFRSRESGFWHTEYFRMPENRDFTSPLEIDYKIVDMLTAGGADFVSRAGMRKDCIVFVSPPLADWSNASGAELARRLGTTFVAAPEGRWTTLDGSHLVPESAELWSAQILEKIKPILLKCGA